MRHGTIALGLLVLAATGVLAAEPALESEDQKTLYALGVALSRNLGPFALTAEELQFVQAGISDGVLDKDKKVDIDTYQTKIQALARQRQQAAAETEKAAGQTFLADQEKEEGVEKTESGLLYKEIQAGTGDKSPAPTDRVKVHYHGTLTDGTVFDSSVERGQPVTFPLNGVIKCWTEGVQKMKTGGKSRLVCPPDIAYGDRGAPPKIKPGATLIFDVELIEIVEAPAAQGKTAK